MASGPGNKVRRTHLNWQRWMGERNRQKVNFVAQNAVHGMTTQLLELLQAINTVMVIDLPSLLLLTCAWQRHTRLPIRVWGSRAVMQAYILGEAVWVAWRRDSEQLTTKSQRAPRWRICQGARLPNHSSAASREDQVSSLVRAELMSHCMCVPPLSDVVIKQIWTNFSLSKT